MTWQQFQLALPADTELVGGRDVAGREHAKGPNGEHWVALRRRTGPPRGCRSEEHTPELQSLVNLVFRLLLEKKKNNIHKF